MPLTCSVLICSYNYGRYVAEAIESVLAQTVRPLEIIVVDDGSVDHTRGVLGQYRDNPLVHVIHQRNEGQCLAVVAGLAVAEGDLIFLLDADDKYEPDHLEKVSRAYEENKEIDYIFTAYRYFGDKSGIVQEYPADKHLGFSVIGAMTQLMYVGAIAPCITLRRNLALTMLPVLQKLAPRWRLAADDLFNLGSSVAGARKLYLAAPTVLYRIHEVNNSVYVAENRVHLQWLLRSNAVAVFCDYFGVRSGIARRAVAEFHSIAEPTVEHYRAYRALIWNLKLPLLERLKMQVRLWALYRDSSRPQPI